MIDEIRRLKRTHSRMTTILNELEVLEDGENVDYSEIITDYNIMVHDLEHRREVLQSRGRFL